MNRLHCAAVALCVSYSGYAYADEDPIDQKLTAAKVEFEKATEKARATLLADLQKAAGVAQKAGDLKKLEVLEAETKAFEEKAELPKAVPTQAFTAELRKARAKLEDALAVAVRDYTKDGKRTQAKATQQELDEFKKITAALIASKDDTRNKWKSEATTLVQVKLGEWQETLKSGRQFMFKEISRTDKYIEIVDYSRVRTGTFLRIEADQLYLKDSARDREYKFHSKGSWDKAK